MYYAVETVSLLGQVWTSLDISWTIHGQHRPPITLNLGSIEPKATEYIPCSTGIARAFRAWSPPRLSQPGVRETAAHCGQTTCPARARRAVKPLKKQRGLNKFCATTLHDSSHPEKNVFLVQAACRTLDCPESHCNGDALIHAMAYDTHPWHIQRWVGPRSTQTDLLRDICLPNALS